MNKLSKKELAIAMIAPLLLCLVAISQIITAHNTTLSSWNGGGFGMFATIDNQGHRYLEIIAASPGGETYNLHSIFAADEIRNYSNFLTFPTKTTEKALLSTLQDTEWVLVDESRLEELDSDNVYLAYLPEDGNIIPKAGVSNINHLQWEDLEVLKEDVSYTFKDLTIIELSVRAIEYDQHTHEITTHTIYTSHVGETE